ncbi:MAG: aldehyde dehydrogenase family protein, partial [Trueperaceae bacterium]|nr:aldehyde dehydrogenase family protein [Trueperaceae bacterium]
MREFGLYIGGRWREATGGGHFDAIDPASGQAVATVALGTPEDVDLAVAAAAAATKEWQALAPRERAAALRRMADALLAETDDLARLETLDAGGTLAYSVITVRDIAARRFEYFAGLADKLTGEQLPVRDGYHVYTVREPLGVTAHIVPWNGPLWEASRSLAPALAAGNAAIIKPAQDALLGAMRLGEIAKA